MHWSAGLCLLLVCLGSVPRLVSAEASITLTWDYEDNQSASAYTYPQQGFRIERSTDNQLTWQLRARTQGETVWVDKAVPKIYVCYRVRAYSEIQWSEPSNVVCIQPPSTPTSLQGSFQP